MVRGMLLMAVINLIIQWSMPFAKSYLNRTPDDIDLLQERIEHNIEKLKKAEEELQAISGNLRGDLEEMLTLFSQETPEEMKRKSLQHSTQSARVNLREIRDQHLAIDVIKKILVRDIGELEKGLGLQNTEAPRKEESPKPQRRNHNGQAYANILPEEIHQ